MSIGRSRNADGTLGDKVALYNFGAKEMAEGASVTPPAALTNAITDALRRFGVNATELRLTPARVWARDPERRIAADGASSHD